MSTDKSEREAFEAEIRKDCGDLSTFGSGKDLHYRNSAVNNAWIGWKARASQPATVVPMGVPAGWKIQPDEEGTRVVSPSGDACYLWDLDSRHAEAGRYHREVLRQLCQDLLFSAPSAPAESGWQPRPELAVWFDSMPESNGKRNWTVILYRKGDSDGITGGVTIERTEYYDRARYEADRMRFLIGETDTKPSILDYDSEIKAAPSAAQPGGEDSGGAS